MMVRLVPALTAALALALGASACGGDDGGDAGGAAAQEQTVKVGGIFDLSGATADVGKPYADGVEDFVEFHNQRGEGPRIELISDDYAYDVAVAERLYSRLRNEGVVAVQGWGTGDTEALRGRINADRIPFMSGSYSEELADPEEAPYNFVVGTTYSDTLRVALKWIAEESGGDAQVAVFHHDSPFGESPLEAGREQAAELGLGYGSYAMPAEATDYVPQLQRAKAQGAGYIVIQNVASPAAQLAKNAASQGMDVTTVCLMWCTDEAFVELAGDAADGVAGVTPWRPPSAGSDAPGFAEPTRWLEQHGGTPLDEKGVHYVQGWYTMALMAEGIRRAAEQGEVTGETIKTALEEMPAFTTGDVSPPMDFTAESHAGMAGAPVFEVENGAWSAVADTLTP
jgi:branched-chain amino acid transport system substrate-binding protein